MLDFWVGSWDVYAGDEKISGGCAIIESWIGGRGSEGKSFFYYYPKEVHWKQVWVTKNPYSNGGVEEKPHVETLENGGTRFQCVVIANNGTAYLAGRQ